MDEESKVIALNADKRPMLPIKTRTNHCSHNAVEVDEVERSLICVACKAKVDPFQYVLSLGYEERLLFSQLKKLKTDIEIKRKELEELTRQVNNLKAQKRRISL